MALLTALLQTCWHRTGHGEYRRLTRFFGTLLVINVAVGVVTGLVQEFEFGMNWSGYSRFVGDVFGAPLAMEGLAAFFLESTFLGLWIFGWGRLSKQPGLEFLRLQASPRRSARRRRGGDAPPRSAAARTGGAAADAVPAGGMAGRPGAGRAGGPAAQPLAIIPPG